MSLSANITGQESSHGLREQSTEEGEKTTNEVEKLGQEFQLYPTGQREPLNQESKTIMLVLLKIYLFYFFF